MFVERGQSLTVYLRKNDFNEELDQRSVELRSMPDGTLQVFLDQDSIEVKSFEEWSPMQDETNRDEMWLAGVDSTWSGQLTWEKHGGTI